MWDTSQPSSTKSAAGVLFAVFLIQLLLTLSISSLFLLRVERVILTVTALSWPCRRRAIRLGCRGLKEISSSGLGNRLVLPFSREISEESNTDGPPAELCRRYNLHIFHSWKSKTWFLLKKRDFKALERCNSYWHFKFYKPDWLFWHKSYFQVWNSILIFRFTADVRYMWRWKNFIIMDSF